MRTLGMMLQESFVSDKQMKDAIYKLLKPYFNKKWKDANWQAVYDLINDLKKNGYTVEVTVDRGGYKKHGDNTWKEYNLKISKDMRSLYGVLSCDPAGPVSAPFDVYDMSLTF